ncbi:hypothetical protein [Planomonospora sp. ID82291]|uniref:hypothetical protein n=1 Tax=Planomonospora sp. ID82291 TaxID=2738136 RepID=UPI0018C3888A|nr:hypothetical protein [Planomonospora sp. ID82291]MBG0818643.1 hypothetical protein [Planomonospora sp. ID82291]
MFDVSIKPGAVHFALQGVGRETRERAGLVLEYPGNVEGYQRATRRGLLTRVHGKLETETAGTVLERADSPKLNIGWPLIEGSFQIDGATSRADLVAQLQRILATATGPKQIYTFDLGVSGATEWWGWELGKWARVLITDHLFPARADGSAGLDTEMQIVSVQVQPGSGGEGEKVTVQTAEFG